MSRNRLDDKQEDVTAAPAALLSPQERRPHGSALREVVPREAQGGWKPPKKRHDPIEVLTASNEGRMQQQGAMLVPKEQAVPA